LLLGPSSCLLLRGAQPWGWQLLQLLLAQVMLAQQRVMVLLHVACVQRSAWGAH
jgi:hypothetical protein